MKSPSSLAERPLPRFFQNSCTGTGALDKGENEHLSQNTGDNPMRPKVSRVSEETREHDMAEQAQTEK